MGIAQKGEGGSTLAQMLLEHFFRVFIFGQNAKGGGKVIAKRFAGCPLGSL